MAYKILMIAPTPFFADRGCHVRILEEIQALEQLGHKITLCTYHIGRDIPGIDIRRICRIPWYQKLEAGPSWHKFYLDELLYHKAKSILKKEHFDLIHAHLHEGVFIASRLRKKFNIPIVADLQGSLTDEVRAHRFAKNNPFILKIFQYAEQKINQVPDQIILSSNQFKEFFAKKFSIPNYKMEVISDGVNSNRANLSIDEKNRLCNELGIPHHRTIIAFLGILTIYQGIEILMKIMPSMIQKNSNIHFLIMGFPKEDHYKKRCVDLGISDHVTWTGRVPYHLIDNYLSCADIAISPKISKTEGNVKLMNYMAIGLPMVVFDIPANREILGEYGVYADCGNTEDFEKKLLMLIDNTQLRVTLRKKLIAFAINNFSWGMRAKQILRIYEKTSWRIPQTIYTKISFLLMGLSQLSMESLVSWYDAIL